MGYAFISYSTKNQMSADAMYMLLKKNEISAWMAPGDIPAGYKYADVINKAIKDCSCVVLLLSNAALNSVWVPKEVERAVNYRKPIIPVQLEDVILNDEFEMYISTDQIVAVQKFDESSDAITKLLTSLKTYTSNQSLGVHGTKVCNCSSTEKTFDEQYNAVFEQNSDAIPEGDSFSPMVRKLKERKTRKTVEQYVLQLKKEMDSNETSNPGNSNANIEILPYKHSLVEIIRGKHFDLSVDPQYVTVLYEIYISWSQTTKTKYYFAKKIDSIERLTSDGQKYLTYYVDDPQRDGNQIVLLHFDKEGDFVLINSGILIGDKVLISKHPTVLEYNPISSARPREEDIFHLDNLLDEEKRDFLHGVSSFGEYRIDPDSTIITIDTETYQPVPREVYFEDGVCKARIKLKSGRSYFSFQIRAQDDSDIVLSNYEIAKCYLYGRGDFPKDVIKAAELFEEIGDAESLYQLAHIWLDESHNDVDSLQDGLFYLEEAAGQGHIVAKAELVYYFMKQLCLLPADEQEMLIDKYHAYISCAVDTELPGALFLAAYVYEKGLFVEKSVDLAFTYYLRAAQADNLAAKGRIGLVPVGSCQSEDECRRYFNNSADTIGLAEYFMGWFLADDPDVMVATEDVLYFYELAANSGVMPAIRELAQVYMYGNRFINPDPAKAICLYEKLTDIDVEDAIRLENYYIKGEGCVQGIESDQKAFKLLNEVLEKDENGTVHNNLAWLMKTGRGCSAPDYKTAIAYFKKAVELGCRRSYYHLGDMYEHGLGVEVNLKEARSFYYQGAELGDKKCKEKLPFVLC